MDDEDFSDVSVVWECLVREDVKEVFTCVRHSSRITQMQDPLQAMEAPPYPLKHWYYPYSERNEIRIGGGVKDGDGA